MMQRPLRYAVLLEAVMDAGGCGSATTPASGPPTGELVVWDWKSGDEKAAGHIEQAKADFARKHPGARFVAQPFDRYYTLLGAALHSVELDQRSGLAGPARTWTGDERLGVMDAPIVPPAARASLPHDGGISYAAAKRTRDPKVAAGLVRSLTCGEALKAFHPPHAALSARTLDELGRLSQRLLSGSATVDEVVTSLAASANAG